MHSVDDTDQRSVAISELFHSLLMFDIVHSAGSLISREASTVLVERGKSSQPFRMYWWCSIIIMIW